jgi:3-hydroxyisobutyrate dehydrogenase-like beta-hydroxyacid dehydrogenase
VWNRTPGKAEDLLEKGAADAPTVDDAIQAGDVVVSCLIDYEAVRSVLGRVQALWG